MFTNNYLAFRKGQFMNDGTQQIKRVDGTMSNYIYSITETDIGAFLGTPRFGSVLEMGDPGVYFGSGTTPPTKEDYTLEAPIASGLSGIGHKAKADLVIYDNGKAKAEGNYLIKNETDEDITVSEVGYFSRSIVYTTVGKLTMYDRSLVEPPVVIPPGEVRMITYRITIENL